jgi:ketosteroid isomerase-like protein
MKSILIILLSTISILYSCKSEEKNGTVNLQQRQNYVPPSQSEQTQQPIQKQQNIDPKVAEEIIAVIKENIAATQAKDKERVLKTLHKDCPQRKSTIQGMDYIFKNYDMVYNLEKAEVLEITGDEAKVYYEQTTRAEKGQNFQPMRSKGIHILKKENGKWKLFKTEYLGNEPIR